MLPSRFKTRPNSLLKLSAMSLVVATLSGCGEDAKDCGGFWDKTFGREECAVATPVATTSTPTPQAQVLTGKFVDSCIEGATYKTPTQSGITGSNCEFKYLEGESVEFFVNKQPLSAIVGRPMLHVYDFNQGVFLRDIDFGNRIAALLQSLDEDGMPANGIKLGSKAQAIFSTPKNLELYGSETDFNSSLSVILTEGGIGHFVSLSDAKRHALQYTSADTTDGCPVAITVKNTGKTDIVTNKLTCLERSHLQYFLAEYSPHLKAQAASYDERIQSVLQSSTPEAINRKIKENAVSKFVTSGLGIATSVQDFGKKEYLKAGTDFAKYAVNIITIFMPELNKNGTKSKEVMDYSLLLLDAISKSNECVGAKKDRSKCVELIGVKLKYIQEHHLVKSSLLSAEQQKLLDNQITFLAQGFITMAAIAGAGTADTPVEAAANIAGQSILLLKEWVLIDYNDEQRAKDWTIQAYAEFMDVSAGILVDAVSKCASTKIFECYSGVYTQGVNNLSKVVLRGTYIFQIADSDYSSLSLKVSERVLRNILAYGSDSDALSRAWGIDTNKPLLVQRLALVEKVRDSLISASVEVFSPGIVNTLEIARAVKWDLWEIEQNWDKTNKYFKMTVPNDQITVGSVKVSISHNSNVPIDVRSDVSDMACQVEGPGSEVINPKLMTDIRGSFGVVEWDITPNMAGNYLANCRFYGGHKVVENKGIVIGRASVGFSYAPVIQRTIKVPSGAAFATHEMEFKTEGTGTPPLVAWDFGDGSAISLASADASIKHTFSQPGNYTLHLYSLSADFSYESTLILHVQSADLPIIDASPIEPHVGDTVTFSLSTVWEDIKEVIWRFGDMVEGIVKAIGDTITYVFEREGVWKVSATAVDTAGQHIGRTEMEVGVKPAALLPVASLVGSAMTGVVGQPVVFVLSNSKALEGKLCSYTFVSGGDVGDSGGGDCSNASQVLVLPSITELYTTAGTFTATLTVTDTQGKTATTTAMVTVSEATQTATSGLLNDTGITQCTNDNTIFADCSAASMGGWFGLNQDGETGRDFLAAKGQLTKTGAGDAGFDFTKISATGLPLPASATEWSCVKDNHTGLMWEVKTDDNGLRDKDNTYKWYNTNTATNGGTVGYENGGNNTQAFAQAVNSQAQALCGHNDWRLPSKKELHSIVNYGKYNPAIDTAYFPNTQNTWYWSSSPVANGSGYAWVVHFHHGGAYINNKNISYYVRLVRSSQ